MGNHTKRYGYVTADETKIATVTNSFKDIGPLNTPLSSLTSSGGSTNQSFIQGPYGKEWLLETNNNGTTDGGGYLRSTNSGGVFDFGTGDFTFESWFNQRTATQGACFSVCPSTGGWAGPLHFTRTSVFYARVAVTTSGPLWQIDNIAGLTQNTWFHWAMTRNGNVWKVWINGVEKHSYTSSTVSTKTNNFLYIGCIRPGEGGFSNYYHKDIRLIKGQCLYTADFTPQPMPSYNEYPNTVYIPGNNITNKGVAVATNRNKFLNRVRTIGTI
jgi:hypothetical protein